jgi:hypothetical protein
MTLSGAFVVAAGSVTGRDHRRAERDGQDGYAVLDGDELVAAVVTDGCSSGRASEIGARIGATWIAALVEQQAGFRRGDCVSAAAEVARELLLRLEVLARSLDAQGNVVPARVDEALLFTFLVAVVTRETTIIFGIGDGIVVVDDVVTVLDPGPQNAPPYVAYGLLGARIEPRVHFLGRTRDVGVVAVATDGVVPIAPSVADLAADPRFARNPSLLRKRLVVLSDRGAFSDDATVAVVQRRSP